MKTDRDERRDVQVDCTVYMYMYMYANIYHVIIKHKDCGLLFGA
jgi:hypothetical protein